VSPSGRRRFGEETEGGPGAALFLWALPWGSPFVLSPGNKKARLRSRARSSEGHKGSGTFMKHFADAALQNDVVDCFKRDKKLCP
jgi:hypothetical protein